MLFFQLNFSYIYIYVYLAWPPWRNFLTRPLIQHICLIYNIRLTLLVQYKNIISFYFKLIKGWDRIWVVGANWKPEGREPNQKEMWIVIFLLLRSSACHSAHTNIHLKLIISCGLWGCTIALGPIPLISLACLPVSHIQ